MRFWCWCAVVLAACTKPNPAVCCLDEADCASIGVSDPERTCADGLACVDNACVVPSCSTDGCSAEAPVCDITLDVCTGCTGPADCDQFETKVCDTDSGACVECVAATDCNGAKPVCDTGSCRGCVLDSECESGACAGDGSCVADNDALYVAPNGTDAGECTRSSPCATLGFAIGRASATRNDVVFAAATYGTRTRIDAISTPAPNLVLHGHNATISNTAGETLLDADIPIIVRDLELVAVNGTALEVAQATVERVTINARFGVQVRGPVTVRGLTMATSAGGVGVKVDTGGALTLDRAVIRGGANILVSDTSATVQVTNLLASGSTDTAIVLASSNNGVIEFSTIANSGASATTTAGVACTVSPIPFPIRSTIIWTAGPRPPVSTNCGLSSTIAGPIAVVGASSEDPQFVNESAGDFHLASNSPALDAIDDGPPLDFEGDARPKGTRFDLGADER